MGANEIHIGDVSTNLQVTIKESGTAIDISAATQTSLLLTKPSGTLVQWTAAFVTDGSNGQIDYDTSSGDFDEVGLWRLQAYVVSPTWTGYSDVQIVQVHANIGVAT